MQKPVKNEVVSKKVYSSSNKGRRKWYDEIREQSARDIETEAL
jgi:hypothetical protein